MCARTCVHTHHKHKQTPYACSFDADVHACTCGCGWTTDMNCVDAPGLDLVLTVSVAAPMFGWEDNLVTSYAREIAVKEGAVEHYGYAESRFQPVSVCCPTAIDLQSSSFAFLLPCISQHRR